MSNLPSLSCTGPVFRRRTPGDVNSSGGNDNIYPGSQSWGATLRPFPEQRVPKGKTEVAAEGGGICYRPPILCVNCGGFLNLYATLDANTGEWQCPLCKSNNPRFHGDFVAAAADDGSMHASSLREIYQELQYDTVTYLNTKSAAPTFLGGAQGCDSTVHLFIFDGETSGDEGAISMFKAGLERISTDIQGRSSADSVRICIAICSRSVINLMRLSGLSSSNPLSFDALPGKTDHSHLYSHFISQGLYMNSVAKVVKYFDIIRSSLISLSDVTAASAAKGREAYLRQQARTNNRKSRKDSNRDDSRADETCITGIAYRNGEFNPERCSANAVVGLGITMANFSKGRVNLMLLCTQGFPLSVEASLVDKVTASNFANSYSQLGKLSASRGCFIDIFHAGLHNSHFDRLDAMSGATGGSLVASESFSDESMRQSFIKFLEKITSGASVSNFSGKFGIEKGSIATIELRSSSNLDFDKIVGPILTAEDCMAYFSPPMSSKRNNPPSNTNLLSSTSESLVGLETNKAQLVVDEEHVQFTVECISSARTGSSGRYEVKQMNGFGSNLSQTRQELEIELYDRLLLFNQDNSAICGLCRYDPSTILSMHFATNQDSSRNVPHSTNIANTGEREYAYLQCVLRFRCSDGSKNVRVWNLRAEVMSDPTSYLLNLDHEAWSLSVAKDIVADYHDSCIALFGGAKRVLREEVRDGGTYVDGNEDGNGGGVVEQARNLRVDTLTYIDDLARSIVNDLVGEAKVVHPTCDKLLRALYHLREGPLLDGPALTPQEAFLMRSHFLTCNPSQARRYLVPSISLHQLNSKSVIDDISLMLQDAPPDSMALMPDTVAFVDTGSSIFIRVWNYTYHNVDAVNEEVSAAINHISRIANTVAASRYPVPSVTTLKRAWSPHERAFFSRLSPSHRDSTHALLLSFPPLVSLTTSTLEDMVSRMPPTDQPSFAMFLWSVIPTHTRKAFEVTRDIIKAPMISTMTDRGEGGVSVDNRACTEKPSVSNNIWDSEEGQSSLNNVDTLEKKSVGNATRSLFPSLFGLTKD